MQILLDILAAFQWLVCYLLKCTYDKYQLNLQQNATVFWAKNNVQVFYSKNLTIAFIQVIQKIFKLNLKVDSLNSWTQKFVG